MTFRAGTPIFQQIVDHVEERILSGELAPESRVPAVRDTALSLEVNPNTVVRSFLELEQAGVIFKKRGLGSFVSPDARALILARRRAIFLETEMPRFVRSMALLGIDLESVATALAQLDTVQKSQQTTPSQGNKTP